MAPLPRPIRLGACSVVLTGAVAVGALSPLAAASAASASTVHAELRSTRTATTTDAVFVFRNDGPSPAVAAVDFDLTTGTVFNRADARFSVTTDDGRVHLRSRAPIEPGSTVEAPLVLLGPGATAEACSIDGAPVDGCSAPEDAAPDPTDATAPTDPTAPAEPTDPTESTESTEPASPADDAAAASDALTVVSGHSDVPLRALGDARAAQQHDGTQAARSDLQPTGRWIRKGQTFVVEVPAGVTGAQVAVGLDGRYFGINGCRDVGQARTALTPGQNIVTAPHDGLVSLVQTGSSEGTVVVRGGAPVPTFTAGTTDRATFDQQLRTWTVSPFFSVSGDRVQADFLRSDRSDARADQNEHLVAGTDLDARIGSWDEAIRTNEAFWGVTDPHRVHFTTPSFGEAGGTHYVDVHHGRVAFPNDHADPHGLLTGDATVAGQRHVWNGIGRVFQQDVVVWQDRHGQADGTASEDLASILLEERLAGTNHLDAWRSQVERFRSRPVAERDFWSNQLNPVSRALAFDQLRRAFGDDFVAEVGERARADAGAGHHGDARRGFVLAASAVSGYDLTPFFEQWGIPVEADLRTQLAGLPTLDRAVWDDFDATS